MKSKKMAAMFQSLTQLTAGRLHVIYREVCSTADSDITRKVTEEIFDILLILTMHHFERTHCVHELIPRDFMMKAERRKFRALVRQEVRGAVSLIHRHVTVAEVDAFLENVLNAISKACEQTAPATPTMLDAWAMVASLTNTWKGIHVVEITQDGVVLNDGLLTLHIVKPGVAS